MLKHDYLDNFMINDFFCPITNNINDLNPLHFILRFELFNYTFLSGKFSYKTVKHLISFFVDVSEIGCEYTACKQINTIY